jgi:hypothetical protein
MGQTDRQRERERERDRWQSRWRLIDASQRKGRSLGDPGKICKRTRACLPISYGFSGTGTQQRAAERGRRRGARTKSNRHRAGSHHLFFSDASLHTCRNVFFFFISLRIQQGWWRLYIYVCVTCLSEQERESSTLHAGNWKECLLTHTHLSSGHRLDGGRGVLHLHVAAQSSPV